MSKTLYYVYVPMTGDNFLGETIGPAIFMVAVTAEEGEFLRVRQQYAECVWGDKKNRFPFDRLRKEQTFTGLDAAIFRLVDVLEDAKEKLSREQTSIGKEISPLYNFLHSEVYK